jgi:hypothetical protein
LFQCGAPEGLQANPLPKRVSAGTLAAARSAAQHYADLRDGQLAQDGANQNPLARLRSAA